MESSGVLSNGEGIFDAPSPVMDATLFDIASPVEEIPPPVAPTAMTPATPPPGGQLLTQPVGPATNGNGGWTMKHWLMAAGVGVLAYYGYKKWSEKREMEEAF